MLTKNELPQNPAAAALWLLGNKWTLYILQHLFVRCHSFGELRRSIDGISDKVLSDNLNKVTRLFINQLLLIIRLDPITLLLH